MRDERGSVMRYVYQKSKIIIVPIEYRFTEMEKYTFSQMERLEIISNISRNKF